MKKLTMLIVGLLTIGTAQIHSMEATPKIKLQTMLKKKQQKELRDTLARYRGAYTLQQLLEQTGGSEVKAETRLRKDLEEIIMFKYQRFYSHDEYVKDKLNNLEKFKTKDVPSMFKQLSESKK